MKVTLFVLCTILTVLQAKICGRQKNSNYQTEKLDDDNHDTMVSSDINLEPEHIEDHEEIHLKPKIKVLYCPGHKNNAKKNPSIKIKLSGANINRRTINKPRTAKNVSGAERLSEVSKNDSEEDKEIKMHNARFAKRVNPRLRKASFYGGYKSKGDNVKRSGEFDRAVVKRDVEREVFDTKPAGGCKCGGCKCGGCKCGGCKCGGFNGNKEGKGDDNGEGRDGVDSGYGVDSGNGGEDGSYQKAVYYDSNVIEGDDENESGNNRFGRNINIPNTRYNKASSNKNIFHGEDADDGKKGRFIKPGYSRPGGYVRPKGWNW